MKIIKCKSCGAPLEFKRCHYCGAHHHGTELSRVKPNAVIDCGADIWAATSIYPMAYGTVAVRPELISKFYNS